ncbi:MAG: hypothetical protein F2813_02765 [Actinobacteria bacterium]|uniref:Unannotated protein n=1 Tax=freshwater metagenome TaxID=449393 RepID=A0A6J5ZDX7_9ZZZZ|nr:hypothetical protein [Actinomycetota bacterium]
MSDFLAIAHPDGGNAGVFAEAAAQIGVQIEEWIPATGAGPRRPVADYRGLVVLGGDENIHEVDRYPYLEGEYALLSDWLDSGRPVLGVCLGAQMIAHVAGGSVFKVPEREFGWVEVDVLPASGDDPIAGFGGSTVTGLLWHDYACEPPAGSTVLANNEVCVQAFRLGDAWAFQAHPEVSANVLAEWLEPVLANDDEPLLRGQAELISAGNESHLAAWNEYGRELFRRFADYCR